MDPRLPFDQAASLLPFGLRQLALALPKSEQIVTEEFRLRVGRKISITLPEGEAHLPGSPIITQNDLRTVLEIATQASAHTALECIRHGFVTVKGGHRVGLCGTAVIKDGVVHNLRELSSVNIRIARQKNGVGNEIIAQMRRGADLPSVLVLAPPGAGKTTILRDLIRGLSSGVGGPPLRIGVADERGELGGLYDGTMQLDLGPFTDVMNGCSKADALMILLRGMNPQVLAMDEITSPEDAAALEEAAGCGTVLLATAHGQGISDLERRPIYREILARSIFQKVLLIDRHGGERRYCLEDLPC